MASININDLKSALESEFNKFTKELLVDKEKALSEASKVLLDDLKKNAPTGKSSVGQRLKDNFILESKYKGVRYINNTKLNSSGKPVLNFLEYGSKGKPFVRKTFEKNIPKFITIFQKYLK